METEDREYIVPDIEGLKFGYCHNGWWREIAPGGKFLVSHLYFVTVWEAIADFESWYARWHSMAETWANLDLEACRLSVTKKSAER